MIRSYKDARTEAVAAGKAPKGFPADLIRTTVRKLTMIDSAVILDDLRSPPGNRLEALKGTVKGSTRFASTISGASVSFGPMLALNKSKLLTITERKKP